MKNDTEVVETARRFLQAHLWHIPREAPMLRVSWERKVLTKSCFVIMASSTGGKTRKRGVPRDRPADDSGSDF